MTAAPRAAPAAQTADGERHVALAVERLSKTFGATRALVDVSFAVQAGRVHGLVGGNGSGKSTLIKILAGVHRGDPGGVLGVDGQTIDADAMTPAMAMGCGLRFVHQNAAVFPELSVAENLAIGSSKGFGASRGRIPWRALRARADELLARFDVDARPDDRLGELGPAQQTMVAIARALQDRDDEGGAILVLDEPTASLPEHEVETLLRAVRRYASAGHTILYVSHRLEEVRSIVDDVTVLRDGRHVVTRSTAGLTMDGLVSAIVGRSLAVAPPIGRRPNAAGPARLAVRDLAGGPIKRAGFDVHAGEIIGITGLLGSGRSELLRMLFGALPRTGGTVCIDDEVHAPGSPAQAMRAGVALVPEDRARDAVFPDLSVAANLSVAQLGRYRRGIRLRRAAERSDADRSIADFGIRCSGHDAAMTSLSGGNQQKVVVARWLSRSPKLLLLDEPTQGVDVGARAELYDVIATARSDGLAVVLVSSDTEELAHVCDRVLVLRDGRIAAEARGPGLSAAAITELLFEEER